MDPIVSVAFWGVVGGLMSEAYVWHRLRAEKKIPYTEKYGPIRYCIISIIWVIAGGLLNVAHFESGNTILPWLAINIGATAPFIFGTILGNQPDIKQ